MGRLLDSLLALLEAGIERIADPERIRCLEEALRNADRVAAEFAKEAAEAHDRLDRVLREVGCALGVEGEPDDVLFAAAWTTRGKMPAESRDGYVLVHADGGDCHGMALVPVGPHGSRQCSGCGIYPDMQSTELWAPQDVRR